MKLPVLHLLPLLPSLFLVACSSSAGDGSASTHAAVSATPAYGGDGTLPLGASDGTLPLDSTGDSGATDDSTPFTVLSMSGACGGQSLTTASNGGDIALVAANDIGEVNLQDPAGPLTQSLDCGASITVSVPQGHYLVGAEGMLTAGITLGGGATASVEATLAYGGVGSSLGSLVRQVSLTGDEDGGSSSPLAVDPAGCDPTDPDPASCAPQELAYLTQATQCLIGPTPITLTLTATATGTRPDASSYVLSELGAFDIHLDTAPCP
jgi:hypothetical protein